jgi:hypothetical protein
MKGVIKKDIGSRTGHEEDSDDKSDDDSSE